MGKEEAVVTNKWWNKRDKQVVEQKGKQVVEVVEVVEQKVDIMYDLEYVCARCGGSGREVVPIMSRCGKHLGDAAEVCMECHGRGTRLLERGRRLLGFIHRWEEYAKFHGVERGEG